jgi:hypothetical protein
MWSSAFIPDMLIYLNCSYKRITLRAHKECLRTFLMSDLLSQALTDTILEVDPFICTI